MSLAALEACGIMKTHRNEQLCPGSCTQGPNRSRVRVGEAHADGGDKSRHQLVRRRSPVFRIANGRQLARRRTGETR
jgi:hypothetical protein